MATVILDHLCKTFPHGVQAVRDLSLQVADGELVVLIGPSGCGKTTTLRMIAGLEDPTSGNIAIAGRAMNGVPSRDRNIAMVFQRPALYPHMSVRDNLAFGVRLRQKKGWWSRWLRRDSHARAQEANRQLNEQIDQTARLVGLQDLLDRLPSELSGGQQQRVALGRAIIRQPAVFLLDEPLSHLDGRLRAELRRELHLLQRHLKATMIYVTHDQAEAMTLADRVVVLDQGRVQQVDRPLAVYERPCNRFVAGFLGWPPMNFIEGQLQPLDGRLCFVAAGCGPLPVPANWTGHAGQSVTLGIRPENVGIGSARDPAASLVMDLALIEPLGHATLVTCQRDGLQLTARLPGRLEREMPSWVEVCFHMELAHLFDRATGVRLNGAAPSMAARTD